MVLQHMNEKHLEEPDEQEKSVLIKTIKFPQNFKSKLSKIDFPKPNYQPLKTKKRQSSNSRFMTTFDQNDSILQYTNKSMVEETSHRMLTDTTTHQQPISQRNLSQKHLTSVSGMDGKQQSLIGINGNNQMETEQILNYHQQHNSNLLLKGNKDIQTDRLSVQLNNKREKRESSTNSLNPHINYIQHIEKISNIELNDQLLASAQVKKPQNNLQNNLQQNSIVLNQQNSIVLGQYILDSSTRNESINNGSLMDNSKSVSLAEADRRVLQKQSVSTNENRRKSNHVRQSSTLSSQVPPRNYSQMNKQKQLYRMLNQPSHLIGMQKIDVALNNQSGSQAVLNQQNLNNDSISKALRDSLIALEKDIIKNTKAQRVSIKHLDSLEGEHFQNDQSLTEQIEQSNHYQSHKNSIHIPTEGQRSHQEGSSYPQTNSSMDRQKQGFSYRERSNHSNKENLTDPSYNLQSQTPYIANKNTKQQQQQLQQQQQSINHDSVIHGIKEINYIQANRKSVHVSNLSVNQNRVPILTDFDKSPSAAHAYHGYEGRQKSKSIFERNNTILTMPDTYSNLENTKDSKRDQRILQNTSRRNIDISENIENSIGIKKNQQSKQHSQHHYVNSNNAAADRDQPEKLIILPIINSIKSTKGDRSISVQRKFSPVHRNNSINRNVYNLNEYEIKRKAYQENEYKMVDISDMSHKYNNHNINYKPNYIHNKHSYQQTPLGYEKNNISFDIDSINNYKRIHCNTNKPAVSHKSSLSPNRNILKKLL